MTGSSKNNRENYPRKCFRTQEKETRVRRQSAFEQLGPGAQIREVPLKKEEVHEDKERTPKYSLRYSRLREDTKGGCEEDYCARGPQKIESFRATHIVRK